MRNEEEETKTMRTSKFETFEWPLVIDSSTLGLFFFVYSKQNDNRIRGEKPACRSVQPFAE